MNIIAVLGALVLLSLFSGYYFTRIRLPRITGYITVGIFLSMIPTINTIVSPHISKITYYVNEVAISILLFEFGLEITRTHLQKFRSKVIFVAIVQSLTTFLAVFLTAFYILRMPLLLSMLVSTFAIPTAPDIVMFVVREVKATENYISFLEELVLFDDFISEFAFFLIFPLFKHSLASSNIYTLLLESSFEIFLSVLLGLAMGIIFALLLKKFCTKFPSFPLITGFLLLEIGISLSLNLHSIIVLLISGTVFSLSSAHRKLVHDTLKEYDVMLFVLFLIVNGFAVNVKEFNVIYVSIFMLIVARIIGKLTGAYAGMSILKNSVFSKLNLGIALLPQSSISIYFAAHAKEYMGTIGTHIFTLTMFGMIFFELAGAPLLRYALTKEKAKQTELVGKQQQL